MIIQESSVHLDARHELRQSSEQSISIRINQSGAANTPPQLSPRSLNQAQSIDTAQSETLRRQLEFEVSLLKLLVERLTGKKIEFSAVDTVSNEADDPPPTPTQPSAGQRWGVAMDISTTHRETEKLIIHSSALVHTADGRDLQLSLSIAYSREFETSTSLSLRAGEAMKDPLVLTYPGQALELSSGHIAFDLDLDSEADRLPLLSPGSSYLALDRNHDGLINNGSELFGALSGDGFADLRQFDLDGNQWIDEQDAVFTRLRLYRPGADGRQQLITLEQGNVGALFLGNVMTPFRLVDANGQDTLGQLRSSGLFISESGEVGGLQQVDVVA